MSNIAADAVDQPRGINGHKAGQYSEHTPSAPHPSTELTLTGDIGVRPAHILPGDVIWAPGADSDLEKVGQAISVGFRLNGDEVSVRLANGRTFTAGSSDIVSVHRDATAPDYDVEADYCDRLAAAHHVLTGAETLAYIVDEESDEAFMIAVVTHPNATATVINRATQMATYPVLSAAISNKSTSVYTLDSIFRRASGRQQAFATLLNEEGYNARVLWDLRQNTHLCEDAAHEMSTR